MSFRAIFFVLLLIPLFVSAQTSSSRSVSGKPAPLPINAPTHAVLLANRPAHIAQVEWLRMMEDHVNRSLYPLCITQAMLDTLDGRQLDMRFQYMMVREGGRPFVPKNGPVR